MPTRTHTHTCTWHWLFRMEAASSATSFKLDYPVLFSLLQCSPPPSLCGDLAFYNQQHNNQVQVQLLPILCVQRVSFFSSRMDSGQCARVKMTHIWWLCQVSVKVNRSDRCADQWRPRHWFDEDVTPDYLPPPCLKSVTRILRAKRGRESPNILWTKHHLNDTLGLILADNLLAISPLKDPKRFRNFATIDTFDTKRFVLLLLLFGFSFKATDSQHMRFRRIKNLLHFLSLWITLVLRMCNNTPLTNQHNWHAHQV